MVAQSVSLKLRVVNAGRRPGPQPRRARGSRPTDPQDLFVSYGDDPAIGEGRLAGERLPPGTPIRLIDDLVFSGQTLRSARQALGLAGLDATTASAILWTYRADAALEELAAAGLTEVICLAHQSLMPD